jgi:hypothetical protein
VEEEEVVTLWRMAFLTSPFPLSDKCSADERGYALS